MPGCSVVNCFKPSASRHRFPNPKKSLDLLNRWVILCGNIRLRKEYTPLSVYSLCRVCSLHFKESDFGPNHTLKKNVWPSLNLPDPLDENTPVWRTVEEPLKAPASKEIDLPADQGNKSINVEIDLAHILKPTTSVTCQKQYMCPREESTASTANAVFEQTHDAKADALEISSEGATLSQESFQEHVPSSSTLGETPKRRSMLLQEVNLTRVKDLSPTARHFYKMALYFKRKALKSNKIRMTLKKRISEAKKFTTSQIFEKVVSSMDRIKARFFTSQLENTPKKARGRRYNLEDKILALALYKQGGAAYRFLSKLFALPSRKTVMKLLNRIPIRPGLHEEVFNILKIEAKHFKNPLDKHCVIMFDEMSIQSHIQPNLKEGQVEGFEDFGYKKSEKIANHCQVFMLRGIRQKWKQPIFYSFVSGSTKSCDLVKIVKMIIRKCHEIGLNIVATVCDQGSNNQAAINYLIKETNTKYIREGCRNEEHIFEIDGRKIIPLYDIPHLFKGLRNNLLKYNLQFNQGGKDLTAKWDDIYRAYQMDLYLGSLSTMPKLTDSHVNPAKMNKMKVAKCTQVFSHSVAVGINVMAFSEMSIETEKGTLKMPNAAMDTAKLLEFLDQLFDSLNGSSFSVVPGKPYKMAVSGSSPHISFWNNSLKTLETFKFLKRNSSFSPPSLKNLICTIKNFKALWRALKDLGFTYMMPRTFNQDPLENFFGKVRQRGSRNINPTASNFTTYYKSLLVNTITSGRSVGANCEDDGSEIFLTLQRFVTQGLPEEDPEEETPFYQVPSILPPITRPLELSVIKYVSGYLIKKTQKTLCSCKETFLKCNTTDDATHTDFLRFKEFKSGETHLTYVNNVFLGKLKEAIQIIRYIFNRNFSSSGLLQHTLKVLCSRISLTDCFHDKKVKTTIFTYLLKVQVFNYAKQINRIMKGLDQRAIPKNAPKIFLTAKEIYVATLKRRKAQNKNRFSNLSKD